MQQIVPVQKYQIRAARQLHPPVARLGHAAVFLMENPDPAVLPADLPADLPGVILRSVVHYNRLEMRIGLLEQRLHTVPQIRPAVVRRNNDRDQIIHFFHSPRNINSYHEYEYSSGQTG